MHGRCSFVFFFFFFNDTATTEIYTLSLHDALPISGGSAVLVQRAYFPAWRMVFDVPSVMAAKAVRPCGPGDRKSTRLNSSHLVISYAVFCLKKKKNQTLQTMSHSALQPATARETAR